jgi:hypothetical protein
MTDYPIKFENVKSVSINKSRWNVSIVIVDKKGKEHRYYASADSFFTDHDNIWFGTDEEYEDAVNTY